ncbi:MAG: lycopene cyclase [Flavobacteriaceae bacterium]|nr:lycopene cyclase [Flavobacteriaceae bacterium]
MNYLYLWLNLGSFIVPFLFSFHPKIQFYKKWKGFLLGVIVMMTIFIPWDIAFTNNGFWGFNDAYITGYKLFNLPIEEWLFFFCIPYACIFTHYAIIALNKNFRFSEKTINVTVVLLFSVLIITLWYSYDKWYTFVNFIYALLILGLVFNRNRASLQPFFATYLIILIPFFLVNGTLTGTGIEDQVVWYNNDENLGIRLLTIPVEDVIYNLGMLLTVFSVTEYFSKKEERH